jgi:hypothetical protein
MQFNLEKVNVEENEQDFRNYGFLNKNLVDDEEKLQDYLFESLNDKVRIYKKSNEDLMSIINNLRNDHQILANNAAYLEKELYETKNKLENAEKELRLLKSRK